MQTSKTLARLYCPNPKDPTEGLRQKANGVWERNEVIDGKRKSFSSRDPIEAWRKRSEYIITREERRQEEQLLEELGPLFEDVAERYRAQVLEMKHGTQKSYLPGITRALGQFRGRRIKSIEPWEIKAFLTGLNGAHTTVSNQKTVLNAIFQLYIDDPQWHGNYNPAKMTTLPRGLPRSRRQPPKEDQVQIVKASLGDPEALPAIIYLCTGERRGEACAIQLKDIDFKNDIINITKAVEWISNQPHITCPKTDAEIATLLGGSGMHRSAALRHRSRAAASIAQPVERSASALPQFAAAHLYRGHGFKARHSLRILPQMGALLAQARLCPSHRTHIQKDPQRKRISIPSNRLERRRLRTPISTRICLHAL